MSCSSILFSGMKVLQYQVGRAWQEPRASSSHRTLLSRILLSHFATQSAHIIHEIPNVVPSLDLAKGRHSGEADPILDDPKQLLVGKALHLFTAEIGCAWIHPSAHRRRGTAIGTMTQAAFRAVECTAAGNAGFCVRRALRYSLAACPPDQEAQVPIGNCRLNTARFPERGHIKTHQRNHNQHHSKHEDRPCSS